MSIFSRISSAFSSPKEEKFNPVYSGTPYIYNTPQEKRMEKNYRNFAREGYQDNDTVYKCISYIARNGSAIQPILYKDATMEKEIDSHPVLDLLKKPNNENSGVAYREALISYKLLSGNAFQYVLRANPNQPPNEMWTLRPDQTKIVLQSPRGIIGYKYDSLGTMLIQPSEIGHTKYWHPISEDMFGMSPLEAAAIFADQSIAAKKWNLALLQNMARPAGAWTIPTVLSPNDRTNLENKLSNKFHGSRNAGRSPVLDAGLTWTSIGLQPAQMDWLPGIQYNAAAIANIYNISPQLIGDTSSTTYENMQQAKVASYTEAIFPELDDLYALWNTWLLPMYKDLKNAFLYYDKESVEVIQEMIQAQKDAKADRANKMWMSGECTLNEAREIAGLPPTPGGDVFRFGAVLVRVSELDKYAEQSLTEPAAPPMPMPEPILPDPTQPSQQPPQKPAPEPNDAPPANNSGSKHRANDHKTVTRLPYRKTNQQTNYKIWQCAAGACEFCLKNDGVMVGIDDSFPNGCDIPEDCHRFCRCKAYTLFIPDGADHDSISNWSIAGIAAAFGVALLASRHDKDVAAQQEQEDEEDEEKSLPQIPRRSKGRTMSKQQYRRFMEEVLV